jgi:tyrosine-protein kinase Etk/Wzc
MQNDGVSQLMAHLAELENRRSDLAQRRTELNPELAALNRRIDDIDGQLGQMARSYERSLGSQVTSLDRVVGGSSGRLSGFPERQVEMSRLERQVTSLGAIHGLLETRLREAEVAEAVSRPTVQVVDAPTTPLGPASPRPLFNLALALVLGLAFGLVLALAREASDPRVHGRREVERRSGLPIVAMIPLVRPSGPLLPVEIASENGTAQPPLSDESGRSLLPARRTRALRKAGEFNGRGVAVEAFRSLGSDLQAIGRQIRDGEIRSLAVTSPGRGDGKTFISCNLALTRAGFGVHTLLIDADMRAGGVARFFDLPGRPGLSELLSGAATAREVRQTLRVSETDTLSVMPAGTPTADAAEILDTSYFEAMLAGAQAVYDLVVIDTPPLNVLPDTAAVVPHVDAVLVVVRDGVTDGRALELTLERLRRTGGPVIGIVFNDVELPKQYAYGSEAYADA